MSVDSGVPANAGRSRAILQAAWKSRIILPSSIIKLCGLSSASDLHTAQLIHAAQKATHIRDFAALERLTQTLAELPTRRAQEAVDYYHAIRIANCGKLEEAREILNRLVEAPLFGVRALVALGAYAAGTPESDYLFAQTVRRIIKARESHLFELMLVRWECAINRSIDGAHRESLDILRDIWPLVREVSRVYPFYFLQFHNAAAVELLANKHVEAARRCITVALRTPFAHPEWYETAEEIAAAERIPSRSKVIIIQPRAPSWPRPQPRKSPAYLRSGTAGNPASSPLRRTRLHRRNIPAAALIVERIGRAFQPRAPPLLFSGRDRRSTHMSIENHSRDNLDFEAPASFDPMRDNVQRAWIRQIGAADDEDRALALLQLFAWIQANLRRDPALVEQVLSSLTVAVYALTDHCYKMAERFAAELADVPTLTELEDEEGCYLENQETEQKAVPPRSRGK